MEVYEKHPGLLLKRITRMHRSVIDQRLRQAGVANRSQSALLMFLVHHTGHSLPSQQAISRSTGITPAAVTVSLKSLETEGLIEKCMDPADNRRRIIMVTDEGRAYLKRVKRIFAEVSSCLFEGFSPEELKAVISFFERMFGNLEKMGASFPPENEVIV